MLDMVKSGAELIREERQRQIAKCGRTPDNDDQWVGGELIECAIQVADDVHMKIDSLDDAWQVGGNWPDERAVHIVGKYGEDHISRLAIAGALIAAEIDRLLRAKVRQEDATD